MSQVLMPKATAVWLVENTTLTFDQISAFTGLHPLEVQAIALDWKWLFIYPDLGIATVNELALPVDVPVHFSITSTFAITSPSRIPSATASPWRISPTTV